MIRKAQFEDFNELSELYVSVFRQEPWNEIWQQEWAYDRLEVIYNSPGFIGYVAEQSGALIGAVMARSNSFKGQTELEIAEFFVSPSKQSTGVGSDLLKTIEREAAERGYSHSLLLTSRKVHAFDFYCKNGYTQSKDMVLMVHDLRKV